MIFPVNVILQRLLVKFFQKIEPLLINCRKECVSVRECVVTVVNTNNVNYLSDSIPGPNRTNLAEHCSSCGRDT